jgi:hypothetical protein
MSVPIKAVPMWGVLHGIGHAIMQTRSYWSVTACDQFSPSYDLTKNVPARICRKCRARLKSVSVPGARP